MNPLYPYCNQIELFVKGRISEEDARRQEKTARVVLERLGERPGVILADEVGMGKTFVALAVAVSAALGEQGKRPVVVMVPPSLREKWPADFKLFCERCLPPELAARVRSGRAQRAVEFLKLLDDPASRRKQILFVTHGTMSRGLNDGWVKLAIIAQAIRGRHGVHKRRKFLSRVLGELLYMKWVEQNGVEVWQELLATPPDRWLKVLHRWEIDPERDNNPETDDDPVPASVCEQLPHFDMSPVFESLKSIPRRRSVTYAARMRDARRAINKELRGLWEKCVRSLRLRLPLLILDEAHHLKNPETRLASLFRTVESRDDANEITKGPLAGVFERMLFLTATPFQLGHAELCSVLDRFGGINWRGSVAPACGPEGFGTQLDDLRAALDAAQERAVTLDTAWGRLRTEDLIAHGQAFPRVESWWEVAQGASDLTPAAARVVKCYDEAQQSMRSAEKLLQPWVIRHLKSRSLPRPHDETARRKRLTGRAILASDELADDDTGIPVEGRALLPFLLAARATTHAADARPVFAEGLASSYEAFLQTRLARGEPDTGSLDGDDDSAGPVEVTDAMAWYLDRLEAIVSRGDADASVSHPKISATVKRVVDTWDAGEKVLVFCHWIATGRTLRQRISEAIGREIRRLGAERLRCKQAEVDAELERLGRRFFDQDSPIRRACDNETRKVLEQFPTLQEHHEDLVDVVRRNVRTPSFLVRFFPLRSGRLTEESMLKALNKADRSDMTLRHLLKQYFTFLVEQCSEEDRARHVEAAKQIQAGTYLGADVAQAFAPDEVRGERAERLVPSVRLVNGDTRSETRQRLMLTFNTPFYPEILVASNVMAEGVDLHLNCRYVIHHDLCWNPSTLEQRTGRIDRIGAKAERSGQSIQVYLPFLSETQDEKMYRVVMDRERWFSVVMGGEFRVKMDARTTEKLARRIPLPESAARRLAFRLEASSK